jgi:hypothetical protein
VPTMFAPAMTDFPRSVLLIPTEPPSSGRALCSREGPGGWGGTWVDATARRRTGADLEDKNPHLAQVSVAGSNPALSSV